jgi:dihydroorotate dehydrogenase (NAD+) catalytic subunit
MPSLNPQPIYKPELTYAKNFEQGPFGDFASPEPYANHGEPSYSFLGYPVYLPFGIPAGPLLNSRYLNAALDRGFDVVVYKTQRSAPFEVNPFPNILYVDTEGDLTLEKATRPHIGRSTPPNSTNDLTITNSFAMPSLGPEYWTADLGKSLAHQGAGQLVIMSVVGTIREGYSPDDYYDDFARVARQAADAGAKVIEVNFSCPNVASEGVLCYTPKAVDSIARRVKDKIGDIPMVAKLGYYSPEQDTLLKEVIATLAPYTSAISSINTIPAAVVNEAGEQALPGKGRLKSGLCGAGVKWAGLDMVQRLSALRRAKGYGYEIIGVGGVMTPADYHGYRTAGADAVQSATGAMWDPDLAIKIKTQKRP